MGIFEKVYTNRPVKLEDLEQPIWCEIEKITVQTFNKVQEEFLSAFNIVKLREVNNL